MGGCDWLEPQPQAPDMVIRLKSRDIKVPAERVDKAFVEAVRAAEDQRLHAILALTRQAGLKDKAALEAEGLTLLFPINSTVWAGRVSAGFLDRPSPEAPVVRWIGAIEPGDKIDPALRRDDLPDWVRDPEGRLKVTVEWFADSRTDEAAAALEAIADKVLPAPGTDRYHVAWAAPERLPEIAALDAVKWIEPGPVPLQPALNFSRSVTLVDAVQDVDTSTLPPTYNGLSGRSVQIGIFDTGIDRDHDDFDEVGAAGAVVRSRILGGPRDLFGHGTQVAGVAGGNGHQSSLCRTGSPYQWRGMAPESELISVFQNPDFGPAGQIGPAIADYGMDISNHSTVQVLNGVYGTTAADFDELIRGDRDRFGIRVPARPEVWAAGNNGVTPAYGGLEGYFGVAAPAKNGIVVGATIANTAGAIDRLDRDSALGPTFDGRIKPDLVAPGASIRTTENLTNCYTVQSGTSLATPAVAGIAALMLENYARIHSVDLDIDPPLPSTVRAVLIQAADDLEHTVPDIHDSWDNPDTHGPVLYHAGPDYATGFGRVNAAAAIRLVREDRLAEGAITDRAQSDEYCLGSSITGRLQATLAWDDEPGEDRYDLITEPALINDLELRLTAPSGVMYLPWVVPPLTPAATPGDEDPVDPADILPAAPGEDHLNNVEQVTVTGAEDGVWRLTVSVADGSVGLLEDAQPYSLAADGPLVLGCSDLVVSSFEITGPAELRPVEGSERLSPHLPVRVTVENLGTGDAHPFKIAAAYRGGPSNPDRDFAVAFTAAGEASVWYPRRTDRLGAGDSWTVEGELVFHPSVSGSPVSIAIEADSCSGDEFVPGYCRAPESDETNNVSERMETVLP